MMQPRLPNDVLVDLAKTLVGQMQDGSVDYAMVATGVKALREHGIDADMFECEVVFDPENHQRPHHLYGLRLGAVRGRVFGGCDVKSWHDLALRAREQIKWKGGYYDLSRARKVDVDYFLEMEQPSRAAAEGIIAKLECARAQVGDVLLRHQVEPPRMGAGGAPRL